MRIASKTFAATLFVLASINGARAGNDPPASTSGIPIFTMDLRNMTSDNLLPFDEGFNIRAAVASDVVGGKLTIRLKQSDSCAEELKKPPCTKDVPKDCSNEVKKDLRGALVVDEQPPGTKTSKLLFSAPELEPNKQYCFAFALMQRLDPDEVDRFRQLLGEQLDPALRTVEGLNLPESELTNLRDTTRTLAKEVSRQVDATIDAAPGSPFAESATPARVKAAFDHLIQPVLAQQNNRLSTLKNYCGSRQKAIDALGAVQLQNGATHKVLQAMHDNRLTSAEIATVIASNSRAFDRLRSEDVAKQLTDDTNCEGAAVKDLAGAWDPSALQAPIQQMDTLSKQLTSVGDMVRALRNDNMKLANALSLTRAEVAEAETRLIAVNEHALAALEEAENAQTLLDKRAKAMSDLVKTVSIVASKDIGIETTSTGDFLTRAQWYISADLGVATAWDLNESFTYAGANFYFRPINKRVPLHFTDPHAFRRLSFMIGASIDTVERANDYKGVLGGKAFLAAAGWRLWESVRVSLGGVFVKEADPNPLIDHRRLVISPFAAVSIDWDVKSTLGKLGNLLGGS